MNEIEMNEHLWEWVKWRTVWLCSYEDITWSEFMDRMWPNEQA